MASVFLSYDREDLARAKSLALALEKAGHSVWWDRHIKGGAQYSNEIEQALGRAEAVVVLWSEQSIQSPWVRDEAAAGRDSGRLVPVKLDTAEPPLGFRQYQTIDLSRWRGRGKAGQLQTMLDAVEALGDRGSKSETLVSPRPKRARIEPRPLVFVAAIALLVTAGLFLGRPWHSRTLLPVVAVAPADRSSTAIALANDLFVQLGSLQAANPNALQLVAQDKQSRADLVLKIGESANGDQVRANLVLLSPKDGTLLWAREFLQPTDGQADLKQQVSYAAALVVRCASEALSAEATKLDQATLKLYLNGCATLADTAEPGNLVAVFREVTSKAPKFEGAWAKLLYVEAGADPGPGANVAALRGQLTKDITAARRLNPQLAEAFLAEIQLRPPRDFAGRVGLAERSVARNSDNPVALGVLARELGSVGRLHDAVDYARRAAEVDPLSQATRDSYITALTYAGRTEAALQELRKAENLWPGASNLLDARFRIHLRYGDPNEARRMLRSGGGNFGAVALHEVFLNARISRTPESI
ncbi:MAG: TIR domain-containing protein, partial [Sphingomicrobium sp.]